VEVVASLTGLFSSSGSAHVLYMHSDSYFGKDDFFKMWEFFTDKDPTHGTVDFVGKETAIADGLVQVTEKRVYIGADMKTKVNDESRGRRSVRIQSNRMYNAGLFIATLDHIPTGCGTWPALWMFGSDAQHVWPTFGEFTIIEGAHEQTQAMSTLHTTKGCDQSAVLEGRDFATQWNKGTLKERATNCDIAAEGQWANQVCSQSGPPNSMGPDFNSFNGGTFAAEWDPRAGHFRTWFWPVGTEPLDVAMQSPNPDMWGLPYSYFRLDPVSCPASHFRDMRIVLDLTFCGDFGESLFAESCPEIKAANLTCDEYVRKHPDKMKEAFWSIRRLDVYEPAGMSLENVKVVDVQKRFRLGSLVASGRAHFQALPGLVTAGGTGMACLAVLLGIHKFARTCNREATSSRSLSMYSQVDSGLAI